MENICSLPREKLDEHFRPQVDFLALENYTHWFCLEKFNELESQLKSDLQLTLYDTRQQLRHDTHGYETTDGDFSQTTVANLKRLKNANQIPTATGLYNSNTQQLVAQYFDEDIQLYRRLFGATLMLF